MGPPSLTARSCGYACLALSRATIEVRLVGLDHPTSIDVRWQDVLLAPEIVSQTSSRNTETRHIVGPNRRDPTFAGFDGLLLSGRRILKERSAAIP